MTRIQPRPYKLGDLLPVCCAVVVSYSFGRLVYLCSLKRAARFCTVYGTSVSWYARHSVCAILPVAEPFAIARNEEDGGAETSSAIHSFK
jgi:hypothetical protein